MDFKELKFNNLNKYIDNFKLKIKKVVDERIGLLRFASLVLSASLSQ